MVFKNVDGHLTTIFSKIKDVSGGFNLATDEVNKYIKLFNELNSTQNYGEGYFGEDWNNFIDKVSAKDQNVANLFENLAKQGASAKANIEGVYAAIIDGNTKGRGNVKALINAFNSIKPENQEAFAKAVGQTNSQLGNYLSNINGAKAGMIGYAGQLVATTVKTTALKVATLALNTALNAAAMLIVNLFISGITYLINKEEELKQKHEEEIQKSKELVETLKEENATLETIIDKYSELSQKTGLTADEKETLLDYQKQLVETYGKEASGIDLVNGKLGDNLAILKNLNDESLKTLEINQKKVYLDAKTKYDDFAYEAVQYSTERDENGKYIGVYRIEFDEGSFNGKMKDTIQNYINGEIPGIGGGIFKDHLRIDGDAIEILGNTNEDFELAYAEMLKIFDAISKISPMLGGVDFSTNSGYQALLDDSNQLFDLKDKAEKAADDLAQTKYTQYTSQKGDAPLDEDDFKKWFEGLLEYANPSGDSALKNALSDIVNSHSGRYIISDSNTGVDKIEQKSLSDIVSSTKAELDNYKEEIDKLVECQSTAKSALAELSESGTLSYETIKKLSEVGLESVISYNAATNSFTVNKEKLDELIGSQKDAIVANMEQSKSNIQLTAQQSKELQEIENWRKITGRSTNDVVYQHKLEEIGIKDLTLSYDLYISMLEKSDFVTGNFSDTISRINQEIDKYTENISSLSNVQSTVKSAKEEQEKFGRLSGSTIKALYGAGLNGAMAYNEMTGETYLLVDAIDELTRAQNDNLKADISKAITETTNKIAEAERQLRQLGNPSDPYSAEIALKLNQDISELNKQVKQLGAQRMELGSLQFSFDSDDSNGGANSVKEAFDKEKSDLDHALNMDLITQEEYYNKLKQLNDKYFKGKTELLDEYRQYEEEVYKGLKEVQINAIQEQIDALKAVNEEKQEEIDLEKAKQALENAKRNKTISVYDSERGWIRETDREAVDSAQKEYDDLVLNEQIEVLENMIDAIENGTNANQSLAESVGSVEQIDGMVDLSKLFKGADSETLKQMQQIRQSVQTGMTVPEVLTNQFDKSISPDSYVVNDNKTINISGITVKADNPKEFISQMEQIANQSFHDNFPNYMNQFGRELQLYKMNHKRL